MQNKSAFIIAEFPRNGVAIYVCARPGFCRDAGGKQIRDGTCPVKSGPEHSTRREHALLFKSHRAAARVAAKCPSAKIVEVLP